MKAQSNQPAMARPTDRFAVLQLASVALMVPMHEVYSLESVLDIDAGKKSEGSVGAVRSADSWFSVFSLSDNLEALPALQDAFRICAILAAQDRAFGIACRGVAAVDSRSLVRHPVPECMRTQPCPVGELTLHGERLYCRTSVADLAALLEQAR